MNLDRQTLQMLTTNLAKSLNYPKGFNMATITTYVISRVRTSEMVECHDELSREWAEGKVKTHNDLYPNDQWVMTVEHI